MPETCFTSAGCLRDVDARDVGAARRGNDARREDSRRRRLAGAVGSEEPEDLALMDLEVQPVDGRASIPGYCLVRSFVRMTSWSS